MANPEWCGASANPVHPVLRPMKTSGLSASFTVFVRKTWKDMQRLEHHQPSLMISERHLNSTVVMCSMCYKSRGSRPWEAAERKAATAWEKNCERSSMKFLTKFANGQPGGSRLLLFTTYIVLHPEGRCFRLTQLVLFCWWKGGNSMKFVDVLNSSQFCDFAKISDKIEWSGARWKSLTYTTLRIHVAPLVQVFAKFQSTF